MASCRVLAGQYLNWLGRALSVTVSNEDSVFTKGGMYDGRPSQFFRFGSAAADRTVTADLQLLANGDFETGTLTSWTEVLTGTGSSGVESVNVHGGAKALKVNGGAAGTGMRYQDVTVRAGETLTAGVWLRGDGTRTVYARILNLQTGKYLTSGGAWSTVAAWASRTTASYADTSLTFTVEPMSTVLQPTCTLRFQVIADGNGDVYADDVALYPGALDWLSIHGHNLDPSIVLTLEWSDDNSAWTSAGTATIAQPTFYLRLSSGLSHRYWRVKATGTNTAAIYYGELVLGQSLALATQPRHPSLSAWKLREEQPQVRSETLVGVPWVHNLTTEAVRTRVLPFRDIADASLQEARDEIYRRCGYGKHPIVLCPDDSKPEVIFGHVVPSREQSSFQATAHDRDLTVVEEPGPVVIPA
jgi:hypothetical protein